MGLETLSTDSVVVSTAFTAHCLPAVLVAMSERVTAPSRFYTLYFPSGKKTACVAGRVGERDEPQFYTGVLQVGFFTTVWSLALQHGDSRTSH